MNLSQYVPLDDRKKVGMLEMTPAATAYVHDKIQWMVPFGDIAVSAASFVTSPWFANDWFRMQRYHLFSAIQHTADLGVPEYVQLVLEHTINGYIIKAPNEVVMPEDYVDKRVVEEVIVENFS